VSEAGRGIPDLLSTPRGRQILFTALYVGEGAPIGFLWWYLPPKLRGAGVDVATITGLTAALTLPWTLKFLWAPLVDVWRGPRWGYRGWILSMQFLMGLALLPVAWLDLAGELRLVAWLLLAHAVFASTQDAAVDAWAIAVTPEGERGRISGSMQAGKYAGRWLFGPGLLLLGGMVGREAALSSLVGVIWASGLLVLRAGGPPREPGEATWETFRKALGAALRRRTTWIGLLVAGLAGAAFEATGAVAGVFLVDRGFAESGIGWFLSASAALMLLGAVAGGAAADRLGHARATGLFVVLTAAAVLGVAVCDGLLPEAAAGPGAVSCLALVYLGAGMLIAASYGLFMDLTDPRLGGTQFSAFMGATNACESWAGFTVGRMIDPRGLGLGYAPSLSILAAISLLSLPLLAGLRRVARPPSAPRGGPRRPSNPAA
jgi:MFS family permease